MNQELFPEPPKRGRGRPPKVPDEGSEPRRKRGRPSKAADSALIEPPDSIYAKRYKIRDYSETFVQHVPSYALKNKGGPWITVNNELGRNSIPEKKLLGFLEGTIPRTYGTIGKWYPSYALLDYDRMSGTESENIKKIRDNLVSIGMSENQFHIFTSESPNSYHVLFKVQYAGKPPTLRLVVNALGPWAAAHNIELYPQSHHTIRLPFGPVAHCVYPEGLENLLTWQRKLWFWDKLEPYNLADAPTLELFPPTLSVSDSTERTSAYEEGRFLFENGLIQSSSRNDAQFKVLYYLFRSNYLQEVAESTTKRWIRARHNGFSQEANCGNWKRIHAEIEAQSRRIWETYVLPDNAHCGHFGWLTAEDLPKIIQLGKGSLVRSRFLFQLLRWYYPRRHRDRVSLAYDVITGRRKDDMGNGQAWASGDGSYNRRLEELEQAGILYRGTGYIPGVMSKAVRLTWEFGRRENALLVGGRSLTTLEESLAEAFPDLRELRGLLLSSGMDRGNASRYVETVEATQKMPENSLIVNSLHNIEIA